MGYLCSWDIYVSFSSISLHASNAHVASGLQYTMFATIRELASLYQEQGGDLGIGTIQEWPDSWDKKVNVVVSKVKIHTYICTHILGQERQRCGE